MIDIDKMITVIKERDAETVGLQFPEGLKRQGPGIAKELESRLPGVTVIISGDPCYGACDIDDSLLDMADVLFHFGHSRLLEDDRIVYMEYYHDVDVEAAVVRALPMLGLRVGVVTTVQHILTVPKIERLLAEAGKVPVVQPGDSRITYPGQLLGCNFSAAPQDVDSILYVGSGNFHPMGVQLSTTVPVIAADPFTGEARKVDIERIMRQRYAIMAKALDAKKWGVIVGMKPGQQRLELAKRIKATSRRRRAHHHPRDHAGPAHLVQGGRLRLDGLPPGGHRRRVEIYCAGADARRVRHRQRAEEMGPAGVRRDSRGLSDH